MKKVTLKVCVSCKKCQERAMKLLKQTKGLQKLELISDCCPRIIVIGDINVEDILQITSKCKKACILQSIEEIPPPPPAKSEEPAKEPPKQPEPEAAKPPAEEPKPAEPPPKPEPAPEPEPEPEYVLHRPTIIIADPLPTPSYTYDDRRDAPVESTSCNNDMLELTALVVILVLVAILLSAMGGGASATASVVEASSAAVSGFVQSVIAAMGTLFLILVGLLALLGIVCLADPRPSGSCKC